MGRLRTACVLGLTTGVIGVVLSFVPAISSLEDTVGLRWLFQTRGPLPPPAGVVVVSIDEPAASHLNLKPHVRDWPRAYHARVIDRLVEQGASVIAFDLQFFLDGSAADDDELARAIKRSGRVVLVQMLERLPGDNWHRQDPIEVFASVAAGLAPAPVPKTQLVSRFWTFLPTTGEEEVPTLPAVVLQAGAAHLASAIAGALKAAGAEPPARRVGTPSELLAYMRDLRKRFKGNPSMLPRVLEELATNQQIPSRDKPLARALVGLYAGSAAPYLNLYGPAGSVCTNPYEVLLEPAAGPCPINGSTVFVGVGRSRVERAQQIDAYPTVYQSPDGVDLSGVELHATAFANLLTGTALRPVNMSASLAILGLLLGASGYLTRTRRRRLRGRIRPRLEAAVIVVLLAATYSVAAYVLFAHFYVIVPIVIPLAVQLPAALILGLLVRPTIREERVEAVCLSADAGGSTAVGQRLAHDAYAALMTRYIDALARCVTKRGGEALPPQGDGFVSLFVLDARLHAKTETAMRLAACHAALDMVATAGNFNASCEHDQRLPLRIGLTVGAVTIRSDADRGAFEAIGDAANVAARLQQLNQELGTSVLASAQLVQHLSGQLELRRIDSPLTLKGVVRAPEVFALVAPEARMPPAV